MYSTSIVQWRSKWRQGALLQKILHFISEDNGASNNSKVKLGLLSVCVKSKEQPGM
jgi:hypothetical protein